MVVCGGGVEVVVGVKEGGVCVCVGEMGGKGGGGVRESKTFIVYLVTGSPDLA